MVDSTVRLPGLTVALLLSLTGSGADAQQQQLSCTRFLWTPICPTGDRHGEVQHGRE
jgi:hypothetical protein